MEILIRTVMFKRYKWCSSLIARSEQWRRRSHLRTGYLARAATLSVAIFAFLVTAPESSIADESFGNVAEYQVKAAFLYKFCQYVEWPQNAFASGDSPIVLGVAGPDSLLAELGNVVRNHTVNGRPVQVRKVDGNASPTGLHVLFIARSEQSNQPKLISQSQKLPLLLVTESPADLDDGGGINFEVQDNRVRFDVGLASVNRQGLRLSAQLLKVARNVRGEAAP